MNVSPARAALKLTALAALASAFAATPASAQNCNVSGVWRLTQSNGTVVTMNMVQQGGGLYGSGIFNRTAGTVKNGRVEKRMVFFRVQWTDGRIGEYSGRINAAGRLSGLGFDMTRPTSQASWFVSRNFAC